MKNPIVRKVAIVAWPFVLGWITKKLNSSSNTKDTAKKRR